MHYTLFRLNIIFRILLVIGLGYAMVYVLTQTHFWLVSFWLALAAIVITVEMLRYIEKSHRELEDLVIAIRQGDFTNTYQQKAGRSGELLAYAYHQLVFTYQRLRREKESNHQYLQNVIEHVSIALLGFDQDGHTTLINPAAHSLLQLPIIRQLSDIQVVDEALYQHMQSLEAGQKVMVKVVRDGRLMQLALQASEFYLQGQYYKLISLQDLRRELEEQELASWQKLIRVLTHEIMNSVIPIANLSGMVHQTLRQTQQNKRLELTALGEEDSHDLLQSLQVMEDRSRGLVNFVKAYRSVTQVAQPNFREVRVEDLVKRVHALFAPTLRERGITWQQQLTPTNLTFTVDLELVEQVLINLIKNSLEALSEINDPVLSLRAYRTEQNEVLVEVEDNGVGMEEEVMEQIFIPFYTTKTEGSGVGLSLSQQIMRLHQGGIAVRSEVGDGTTFTLQF
uniref:histidine kinase n=1 Tax=Roseihalotalea indica TaxID=2867963 RepID=A0AA49GI55_9BACT|nr:ATP-binding protein [Tunicatimonas sp. TK19036]